MIKDNFRYKNIKKRTIKHGNIVKVKKNQNSPKFIIGYCLNIFERQLIAYTTDHLESLYMEETFQIIREWIEQNLRDKLNLKHFK